MVTLATKPHIAAEYWYSQQQSSMVLTRIAVKFGINTTLVALKMDYLCQSSLLPSYIISANSFALLNCLIHEVNYTHLILNFTTIACYVLSICQHSLLTKCTHTHGW